MAINKGQGRREALESTIDPQVQAILDANRTRVQLLFSRKDGADLVTLTHNRPGFIKISARLWAGTVAAKLQRSNEDFHLLYGFQGESSPWVELYIREEEYEMLNRTMDETLYANAMTIEVSVNSEASYWKPVTGNVIKKNYTLEAPRFHMETAEEPAQVRVEGTAKSRSANKAATAALEIEEESPFAAPTKTRKRTATAK